MLVLHEALQELALALPLPHPLAGHSDSCKGHDAKPRKACVASGDAVGSCNEGCRDQATHYIEHNQQCAAFGTSAIGVTCLARCHLGCVA